MTCGLIISSNQTIIKNFQDEIIRLKRELAMHNVLVCDIDVMCVIYILMMSFFDSIPRSLEQALCFV